MTLSIGVYPLDRFGAVELSPPVSSTGSWGRHDSSTPGLIFIPGMRVVGALATVLPTLGADSSLDFPHPKQKIVSEITDNKVIDLDIVFLRCVRLSFAFRR